MNFIAFLEPCQSNPPCAAHVIAALTEGSSIVAHLEHCCSSPADAKDFAAASADALSMLYAERDQLALVDEVFTFQSNLMRRGGTA